MSDKTEKKYMKKSEIVTFGIGLFGVALMTGWMPDYTATFFADFAFKGKGFDSATMANAISMVFLVAGIIGAVCELVIGYLVDNTRTKLGKVKPGWASAWYRWPWWLCWYSLHPTPPTKPWPSCGCL